MKNFKTRTFGGYTYTYLLENQMKIEGELGAHCKYHDFLSVGVFSWIVISVNVVEMEGVGDLQLSDCAVCVDFSFWEVFLGFVFEVCFQIRI